MEWALLTKANLVRYASRPIARNATCYIVLPQIAYSHYFDLSEILRFDAERINCSPWGDGRKSRDPPFYALSLSKTSYLTTIHF
jgi:hypothetical protein